MKNEPQNEREQIQELDSKSCVVNLMKGGMLSAKRRGKKKKYRKRK
jgi:hypothetical protein